MNILNENATTNATATVASAAITSPTPIPNVKVAKLALGFIARSSDAVLIAWAGRIITGLTGNAHFPTTTPALAVIEAARAMPMSPQSPRWTAAARRSPNAMPHGPRCSNCFACWP